MVDRGAAGQSLLGQYSLPADISEVDHPQVPGYDFVYRNTDDVRYKQVLDWMNKSLVQPDPDYSMIRYVRRRSHRRRNRDPAGTVTRR